jgi:hypothetical protein
MTADQAMQLLAAYIRKVVWRPDSSLRHTDKIRLRRLLDGYDEARSRKTGFERLMDDDEDDLPGSKTATSLPLCKWCKGQFRPRRADQKYCRTECRKAAFFDRQARIRHTKPKD